MPLPTITNLDFFNALSNEILLILVCKAHASSWPPLGRPRKTMATVTRLACLKTGRFEMRYWCAGTG